MTRKNTLRSLPYLKCSGVKGVFHGLWLGWTYSESISLHLGNNMEGFIFIVYYAVVLLVWHTWDQISLYVAHKIKWVLHAWIKGNPLQLSWLFPFSENVD